MNITLALSFIYLALTLSTSALPLPPLSAEKSLSDSVRSFESAYTQLDDAFRTATEKRKAFSQRKKWATGVVAGLTTLGTGGFIASSAVPMANAHIQAKSIEQLRAAVARADAAHAAEERLRGEGKIGMQGGLVKRAGVEEAGEVFHDALDHFAQDQEGEARGALIRGPTGRVTEVGGGRGHVWQPYELDRYPRIALPRSKSAPTSYAFPQDPPPPYNPHPESDSFHRSASLNNNPSDNSPSTSERLTAIENALLDIKQHHHEQAKLSPFTKAMIAIGVVNAVGGGVSAELSAENAVEAAKRKNQGLPDVSNLDRATCENFKADIAGLDCSKAKGPVLAQ